MIGFFCTMFVVGVGLLVIKLIHPVQPLSSVKIMPVDYLIIALLGIPTFALFIAMITNVITSFQGRKPPRPAEDGRKDE